MRILTVRYSYTFSLFFTSIRTETTPIIVTSTWARVGNAIPFTLITLVLGWWNLPMGPINTFYSLGINLTGGEILHEVNLEDPPRKPDTPDPETPRPGTSWICSGCHMVNNQTTKCLRCGKRGS